MRVEQLVGERFKERPADCVIDSHALMVRGGYMKAVGGGIFSLYTPLRRITRKIEEIIREEMDALGGQEVLFPVVLPASLWEESGRLQSVGAELMRMKDRNGSPLVLGMTHEEAAVQLVKRYGGSYSRYPFMIYQVQTKFRDEARPRGGLIRVREFTMKDAYSFHTSQEDLEVYYQQCLEAYHRIFARAGLPQVVAVASDSGMMGGHLSHEFMLLTPVGEDSVALCPHCDYRANLEAAEVVVAQPRRQGTEALTLAHTPDAPTIEAVCQLLNLPVAQSCKAVAYQADETGETVIVFLRGDLEVNETKLTNLLGRGVHPAVLEEGSGLCPGYLGPHGLPEGHRVLFDRSLAGAENLCCGANRRDYHYTGLSMDRDCPGAVYQDLAKVREGDLCPRCGQPGITISRGIEVGNIFQLGTKYTQAMGMQYQDRDDSLRHPIMGCYGIGVGRLAASVCEASHDDYGPIWPMAIAPWQVEICCLRIDDPQVKAQGDALYRQLQHHRVEVLYDDRVVSAGAMFADADLLGVPLRVVVSPRNLAQGCCEVLSRDKTIQRQVPVDQVAAVIQELIQQLLEGSPSMF